MTTSQLFTLAHKNTRRFMNRKMNKKYNYSVMFSYFLKNAYVQVKKQAAKILTNFTKETEKAVLAIVNVTFEKRVQIKWSKPTIEEITEKQEMWIPKSQLANGIVSKWFLSQNNYISITN